MQQAAEQTTGPLRWGAPASVAIHALILALLVFGLPHPLQDTPEEPEAVNVELVPPPEPEPKPKPDEQAKADEPPPADAVAAQAPPEQALNEQNIAEVFGVRSRAPQQFFPREFLL